MDGVLRIVLAGSVIELAIVIRSAIGFVIVTDLVSESNLDWCRD